MSKQIWIHSLHPWLRTTEEQCADYFEFLTDTSKWKYVAQNADAVQIWGQSMPEWTDGQVKGFCDMVKASGLRVAFELCALHYTDEYPAGSVEQARHWYEVCLQKTAIPRMLGQGVGVDHLNFDGPLLRSMFTDLNKNLSRLDYWTHGQSMTEEQAVSQFVHFARCWHELLPDAKINYLFNFPINGYKGEDSITVPGTLGSGDAYTQFLAIESAMREAGIPLYGVTLDAPYDYDAGGKTFFGQPVKGGLIDRVLDFEKEIKSRGYKSTIIFNCQTSGDGGPAKQYYEDTLKCIDEYEKRGGDPDIYIVESWYPVNPRCHLPESEPYTLTNLAAEVIRHVREGKKTCI